MTVPRIRRTRRRPLSIGDYRVRMPLFARLVAPTSVGRAPRHRPTVALVTAALTVVVLLAGCVAPKNQASAPTPGSTSGSPTGS